MRTWLRVFLSVVCFVPHMLHMSTLHVLQKCSTSWPVHPIKHSVRSQSFNAASSSYHLVEPEERGASHANVKRDLEFVKRDLQIVKRSLWKRRARREGDLHSLCRHPKFQLISFDFHLIEMVDSDRTQPFAPPKYKPSATWESSESPCKNAILEDLFQMASWVSEKNVGMSVSIVFRECVLRLLRALTSLWACGTRPGPTDTCKRGLWSFHPAHYLMPFFTTFPFLNPFIPKPQT